MDYNQHPDVVFGQAVSDLELEGLELVMVIPLSKIKLKTVQPYKLIVTSPNKLSMYYELCNGRLSQQQRDLVWSEWVKYLRQIKLGIPLSVNPPTDKQMPSICSLYAADDIVASYRHNDDGRYGYQHLHELVRSMNMTSGYNHRRRRYSLSLEDTLSGAGLERSGGPEGDTMNTKKKTSSLLPPDLNDSTNASSIVTHIPDEVEVLNKNNGANEQHEGGKSSPPTMKIHARKSHMHESLDTAGVNELRHRITKNASSLSSVDNEEFLRKDFRSSGVSGRQFIRSSSIAVRPNGTEKVATRINRNQSKTKTQGSIMTKNDREAENNRDLYQSKCAENLPIE